MALYAFDGTWNDSSAPAPERNAAKDTNVHRFRERYQGEEHYMDGVGTRYGLIGKVVGGLTGAGADARVREQFDNLRRAVACGDRTIDVVGYSRGAAIARMFLHRIESDFEELDENLDSPPEVRFLGLFDTVASFGVPWNNDEGEFRPDIPDFVAHTFHAMALDETRETFGIERCLGDRSRITEVWFRGGHGDIGGNATYVDRDGEVSNRARSDIALEWMVAKARDCGLELDDDPIKTTDVRAPVTAAGELIRIGNAGTLSRRIHLGDLVHYTVEQTELTRGIDGRLLRRIAVPTRIENRDLERRAEAQNFAPPRGFERLDDNELTPQTSPSLVELSSRRYPFDVPPARTWSSWLERWKLEDPGFDPERLREFWAPTKADQALAWDVYVELASRITTQELPDDEGNDKSALNSVYSLFELTRSAMHSHGRGCANAGTLLLTYLNRNVRDFTARWHRTSIEKDWKESGGTNPINLEFRAELRALRPLLSDLSSALSELADARLS